MPKYMICHLHLQFFIISECSRRVWEQVQQGIESPTLHCLENGNYEPLQCENGYCYCIDPNTTLTYGPTVPEKAMFILPCCKLFDSYKKVSDTTQVTIKTRLNL